MMKNGLFACVLWTACVFGLLEAVSLQYPAEKPCIMMEMDAQFSLTDGVKTKEYSLGDGNVTSGDCTASLHNLLITFSDENTLRFSFPTTGNSVVQMDIVLTYDPSWFINGSLPAISTLDDEGVTTLSDMKQVYECSMQFKKNFPPKDNNISMTAEISNVKIQAYNVEDGNFSSDVFVCAQDQNNTTVAPVTTSDNPTTQPPLTTNATEPQSTNATDSTATTNQQTTVTSVTTSEATTTVGPTIPPPAVAEFKVKKNDSVCLILKGALQLQVNYEKKDKSMGISMMNIPANAAATGTCGTSNSSLILTFGEANASRTITYNFEIKEGNAHLTTWEVSLDLDEKEFPDHANGTLDITVTQDLLLSKESMYFMCDAKLTLTDQAAIASMFVTDLKVQAFNVKNGDFSQYGSDCSADVPFVPKNKVKETFSVSEGNVTCIVFQAEMVFDITYLTDGKNVTKSVYLPPKGNVTVNGSCNMSNGSSQMITMKFYDDWMLKMTFMKTSSSENLGAAGDSKYHLGEVELTYTLNSNLFPEATNLGQISTVNKNFSHDELSGSDGGSYMCASEVTLDISHNVTLKTTNLQYQAFSNRENTDFGSPTECKVDEETNSIVPIAVGAALAGLVVIVLIAYLIGRRRSRTGYEQV